MNKKQITMRIWEIEQAISDGEAQRKDWEKTLTALYEMLKYTEN